MRRAEAVGTDIIYGVDRAPYAGISLAPTTAAVLTRRSLSAILKVRMGLTPRLVPRGFSILGVFLFAAQYKR